MCKLNNNYNNKKQKNKENNGNNGQKSCRLAVKESVSKYNIIILLNFFF